MVPIPIALKIFGGFHLNPIAWEYNIEKGDLGDVGAEYEAWSKKKGFGKRTAVFWQYFLWYAWPFLIAYALYIFIFFYILIHRLSNVLFADYKRKVFRRKTAYYLKNLDFDNKEDLSEVPFFSRKR
jgi:hypothetical protein